MTCFPLGPIHVWIHLLPLGEARLNPHATSYFPAATHPLGTINIYLHRHGGLPP